MKFEAWHNGTQKHSGLPTWKVSEHCLRIELYLYVAGIPVFHARIVQF